MSSQHVQHRANGESTQANRPEPIDTSGQTLPSNSREGARAQPQLLTNQEFDAINNGLLRAGEAIEVSRQKLFETRFVASSALQELDQERQIRHRWCDAYNKLHVQYGRKVAELHEMTAKCLSLHNQLEEAQNAISHYDSTFKESESRVTAEKAQLENTIRSLEGTRAMTAQQIQAMLEDGNSASRRIDELEKELSKTLTRETLALQKIDKLEKDMEQSMQEHRAEVNMMVARESLGVQRIDELQNGMDKLIQEHQATMDITVDRMNSAEQKVEEFRKIMGTSEHERAASACLTPSPELRPRAAKRPRSETKQQHGRTSKHRRCKDTPKVGDGDSIVVELTD